METELASWMERTAGLPLAFAQVREDALQDRWIVDSLARDARVLMIASGGCTAALLATRPNVAQLHLVDANPAQLALAQLKLRLLTLPVEKRLAILGHAEMDASSRAATLTQLLDELQQPTTMFGPFDFVVEKGPDHVGRYELLFDRLRAMLGEHLPELHRAMSLSDPIEQASCLAVGTGLGDAFDRAIDEVMFLPTNTAANPCTQQANGQQHERSGFGNSYVLQNHIFAFDSNAIATPTIGKSERTETEATLNRGCVINIEQGQIATCPTSSQVFDRNVRGGDKVGSVGANVNHALLRSANTPGDLWSYHDQPIE